jgi:hypothetical protein
MRLLIIAFATALLFSIVVASTSAQTGIGVLDVWLKARESVAGDRHGSAFPVFSDSHAT